MKRQRFVRISNGHLSPVIGKHQSPKSAGRFLRKRVRSPDPAQPPFLLRFRRPHKTAPNYKYTLDCCQRWPAPRRSPPRPVHCRTAQLHMFDPTIINHCATVTDSPVALFTDFHFFLLKENHAKRHGENARLVREMLSTIHARVSTFGFALEKYSGKDTLHRSWNRSRDCFKLHRLCCRPR